MRIQFVIEDGLISMVPSQEQVKEMCGNQVQAQAIQTPQGWQCPSCNTVYAPHISKCPDCFAAKIQMGFQSYPPILEETPEEEPNDISN